MLYKGEIRHVVLILSLVVLLAVICISSELYLDFSCDQLIKALENVKDQEDLIRFDEEFDRITDVWLALLPHSEIDRLSEVYFHMYSAPEEVFEQEKQALLHFLQMVPDRTRLSIENIL